FPIDPKCYPQVFAAAPQPASAAGKDAERMAVQSLIDTFGRLPSRDDADPSARAVRQRDKVLLKQRLAQAHAAHAWLREWIQAGVDRLNNLRPDGEPAEPEGFDLLDALLEAQAYRLAFWRVAGDDVNYRRFFDVSTLAALRMEDDTVFESTHRTVMRWLGEERLAGLRVDHPDGLSDPQAYCETLQRRYVRARQEQGQPPRALYIVVEKILADHERVPDGWPVHGGTGYRFANLLNGLFVDGGREAEMNAVYRRFVPDAQDFDAVLRAAK